MNTLARTRVIGNWTAKAFDRLVIADPLKFAALLGIPVRRIRGASIGMRQYEALAAGLSVRLRRDLERMLTGGNMKWADAWQNIVVNQGLDDLLDVTLSGATQDTTWFVGLTDGTPTPAAADTLASHAGWVEVTAFDEVNRVAWVEAGVSSQSITNSASPAAFTINANGTTIGGAFLAGVNTGTAGRLYAVGAFTAGDKLLDDNDTLDVTATFTTAAA